jgi:hypothetical protein
MDARKKLQKEQKRYDEIVAGYRKNAEKPQTAKDQSELFKKIEDGYRENLKREGK